MEVTESHGHTEGKTRVWIIGLNTIEGISPDRGETREKSLRFPHCQWAHIIYYTWLHSDSLLSAHWPYATQTSSWLWVYVRKGQISMKQGCRDKGQNKENRDEWRGIRGVMEIEQTWKWRRYSRGEAAQDGLVRDPLVIWYLTVQGSLQFTIGVQLCFMVVAPLFLFDCSKRGLNAVIFHVAFLHIPSGCIECSCVSSRSVMISLRAFFALSSLCPVLSFALFAWAMCLTVWLAWACIWATTVGLSMVVLLKWLCRSSDAPWCECCPCGILLNLDPSSLIMLADLQLRGSLFLVDGTKDVGVYNLIVFYFFRWWVWEYIGLLIFRPCLGATLWMGDHSPFSTLWEHVVNCRHCLQLVHSCKLIMSSTFCYA